MIKAHIKILLIGLFAIISQITTAGELTLKGVYRGEDILVQNGFSKEKKMFCTQDVFVNGEKRFSNPKVSAYKIDLSTFELNEAIEIKITYINTCAPQIINPQAIQSSVTAFKFLETHVEENALSWITQGEPQDGEFIVEHLLSDAWKPITTVKGKGSMNHNFYSIAPSHHNGQNYYRIVWQHIEQQIYSDTLEFSSSNELITFTPHNQVNDSITLSREAYYEISTQDGKPIMKGRGKTINVKNLKNGLYHILINNQTDKFIKL